ncbi:hypothetical protein BDY24DRAFT_335085, partial [Mrakia frigida]|uniref:Arf family guanine nucleotide exchange factor SYT1 n=1 Tax=Mrakia frigida TaxID=29902 RepID=UPI003FCC155C
ALRAYMSSFDFSSKPLDVALRRLLMEVALPRETQQIDRVMESFAKQYIEGNPGLFTNEDHPYILAFSLIMLHTDAFNKSNKNKMSKADYIKNTRLDGVLPEVLDTFFDNITFTPFVFVEDDDVLGSQRTLPAESSLDPSSTALFSTSQGPSSGSSLLLGSKSTKVDVYYLISENLTQTLRADVESHIPLSDPFSYHGGPGRSSFDTGEVHSSFVTADIIEIGPAGGGGGGGGIGARKPSTGSLLLNASVAPVESKVQTLRLTKFGVLSRKGESLQGGRKASNRKWRDWTVILTGSQLLFFKDPAWATVLQKQAEEQSSIAGSRRGSETSGRILLPKMSSFKPDEVLSVKDSIAITETSYSKYSNAFRFVMPHGRQYLLQAADETELTDWMSRINYASAFKTASIRMRGMGMDSNQAQLAGAAAAASHARALRSEDVGSSRASSIKASSSVATGDLSTPSTTSSAPRSPLFTATRLRSLSRPPAVDLESPIFSPEEDGEQLETAFMEIKAELAAGRGGATRLSTSTASEEHANRARAASVDASFSARSSTDLPLLLLQFKVDSLQSKISATEMHLNAELRVARNLAVLTPFQRSTRDRIQLAVLPLAKKIRHLRMELARLRCYEEILRTDLQVETDSWKAMKSM